MSDKVTMDMRWSAKIFCEKVWPLIRGHLGGGDLMEMEGRPDTQLAKELDMKAGIDGWHIHKAGMRGIASRVQVTSHPWDTFTVRMARDSGAVTEFEKRKTSLDNPDQGWIYPAVTVQAYISLKKESVISCGLGKTKDIIEFIAKNLHTLKRTSNAEFAVCPWGEMQKHGYDVEIIQCEKAAELEIFEPSVFTENGIKCFRFQPEGAR